MSEGYNHLVDPVLKTLFEAVPNDPITLETLPERRLAMEALFKSIAVQSPPQRVLEAATADAGRTVQVRIFEPATRHTDGAVFAVHGGGYVVGTAEMMDGVNQRMANETGAVVAAVDYRLAPETPFPGPLQDCFDGYSQFCAEAASFGVNSENIAIQGDSAGGGLAAALCLLIRDRKAQQPVGQLLVYPMLDHRTAGEDDPDPNPTVAHYSWSRENNRIGWASMQGDYALDDDRIGYFSPARAADVSGLPPTFIGTGSLDLFLNEDLGYARRLSLAGVALELHVYPGGPHGFERISDVPIAQAFRRDQIHALRTWLGSKS